MPPVYRNRSTSTSITTIASYSVRPTSAHLVRVRVRVRIRAGVVGVRATSAHLVRVRIRVRIRAGVRVRATSAHLYKPPSVLEAARESHA